MTAAQCACRWPNVPDARAGCIDVTQSDDVAARRVCSESGRCATDELCVVLGAGAVARRDCIEERLVRQEPALSDINAPAAINSDKGLFRICHISSCIVV